MPKPRAASTVRKTPNFDFIFGRYSHSNYKIPYFQVTMSFNDAATYLRLVSEMPGAASMEWNIEELFQREIDWRRVERKIVPYLKQQNQAQFFNSLTIALVPIKGAEIGAFSGVGDWHAPSLEGEEVFDSDNIMKFGPITCGYWGHWDDASEDNARLGQLCWNTQETCGIAIDGQHRLAAIKELVGSGDDIYNRSSVPVIFIVLDPTLGYSEEPTRNNLINTVRGLFIDLNKHAQKVSRARQILLDDRDPAAICVRALVGDRLVSGKDELDSDPPELPLSLVDWHSERALFNEGPYLTTILGLDWAVAKVLGIKPFEDPMAFDAIGKLIDRLEQRLGIALNEARTRLEECSRYERPFSFVDEPINEVDEPVNELQRIGEGFTSKWSSPMTCLLTVFRPYRQLIDIRESYGSLSPEFCNWFAMKQTADEARGAGRAEHILSDYERNLANRDEDPIAASDLAEIVNKCKEHKIAFPLAFTVVFQRALILAYLQFVKITQTMVDRLAESAEVDLDDLSESDDIQDSAPHEYRRADEFVKAMNEMIRKEPEFLKLAYEYPFDLERDKYDRFWLSSFATPDGPIDFSQVASSRASDILLLAAMFWLYKENLEEDEADFSLLMSRADDATSGIDLRLQQCLNRMWAGEQSIAARILRSRDREESDENKWAEIEYRAAWLWDVISRD